MRRGPGPRLLLGGALLLGLLLLPATLGAQGASAAATPSKALLEAQAALAKLAGTEDFETRLASAQADLAPGEAAALAEFAAAKTKDPVQRQRILASAADLRLLLGDYAGAAADEEGAAGSSPLLRLRAARLWLAAGESEKSSALAAAVIGSGAKGETLAAARLVSAWASLLSGSRASALALAGDIADPASSEAAAPALRREALFLLWAAGDEGERKARAKELASAWPESPEALIAAESPSVSLAALPHWYLGGLILLPPDSAGGRSSQSGAPTLGEGQASPGPAASGAVAPPSSGGLGPGASATPAPVSTPVPAGTGPGPTAAPPAPGAGAPAPAGAAAPLRCQAGVFSSPSKAETLVAELKKKGFIALVSAKTVGGQNLFAVILSEADNGPGLADRLRNSGYEIWLLDD